MHWFVMKDYLQYSKSLHQLVRLGEISLELFHFALMTAAWYYMQVWVWMQNVFQSFEEIIMTLKGSHMKSDVLYQFRLG